MYVLAYLHPYMHTVSFLIFIKAIFPAIHLAQHLTTKISDNKALLRLNFASLALQTWP